MLRSLAKIIERGHLARGVKPVHWCFDCGSALAEAEIEYADKTSPAVDVAYEARDPQKLANHFGVEPGDAMGIGSSWWDHAGKPARSDATERSRAAFRVQGPALRPAPRARVV